MSIEGRVWARATAHFDHVRPGDRLHVDPTDPYVVGNRLFEAGLLVLEGPAPDASEETAAPDETEVSDEHDEHEPETELPVELEPEDPTADEPEPPAAESEPSSE